MKTRFFNRFHIPFLVVVSLLGLGLIFSSKQGDASGAITPDQCCRCHQEVCEQSVTKRYVHAPVLENHCAVCHVAGSGPTVARQGLDEEARGKIEWFARSSQEKRDHWFELPSQLATTTVSVQIDTGSRPSLQQEVELPSLDQAQQFPLLPGEAKIFDLRVVEVKKGVFLSARITWKTDRITDAQVLYGEERLGASTALDGQWATDHEITVTGLDADRDYTYVAVSRDIHGNKTMSPQKIFSTRNFYNESPLQSTTAPEQLEIQANFYKEQGRLFGHFANSHPVTMRLGRSGEQALRARAEALEADRPQEHLELTDPYSLTITVCVGCHPQAKGELSHPVDVRPKAGMHIPPDYYTMADGRLSCMSCHQAHASDNEYRLTRARRKDLCLGCHRNFG